MKSHKGEDIIQLFDAKDQVVLSQDAKETELQKQDSTKVRKLTEIEELQEKWNFEHLQKRFEERIDNHIKCNEETKR